MFSYCYICVLSVYTVIDFPGRISISYRDGALFAGILAVARARRRLRVCERACVYILSKDGCSGDPLAAHLSETVSVSNSSPVRHMS